MNLGVAAPPAELVVAPASDTRERRLRQSRTAFLVCATYTVGMTLVWLFFLLTGPDGGRLFPNYGVSLQQVGGLVLGIIFFFVTWSYLFHWIKVWQLRRLG